MVLILCGFVVFTTGRLVLSLASLFVLVFFYSTVWRCGCFAWRRGGCGLCASRALLVYLARFGFCPFSLPLGVGDLAAAYDCGAPWSFLLTFWNISHQSKIW